MHFNLGNKISNQNYFECYRPTIVNVLSMYCLVNNVHILKRSSFFFGVRSFFFIWFHQFLFAHEYLIHENIKCVIGLNTFACYDKTEIELTYVCHTNDNMNLSNRLLCNRIYSKDNKWIFPSPLYHQFYQYTFYVTCFINSKQQIDLIGKYS